MKKIVLTFLVVLIALFAIGCSALVSVGHSNTNTINKTDKK